MHKFTGEIMGVGRIFPARSTRGFARGGKKWWNLSFACKTKKTFFC